MQTKKLLSLLFVGMFFSQSLQKAIISGRFLEITSGIPELLKKWQKNSFESLKISRNSRRFRVLRGGRQSGKGMKYNWKPKSTDSSMPDLDAKKGFTLTQLQKLSMTLKNPKPPMVPNMPKPPVQLFPLIKPVPVIKPMPGSSTVTVVKPIPPKVQKELNKWADVITILQIGVAVIFGYLFWRFVQSLILRRRRLQQDNGEFCRDKPVKITSRAAFTKLMRNKSFPVVVRRLRSDIQTLLTRKFPHSELQPSPQKIMAALTPYLRRTFDLRPKHFQALKQSLTQLRTWMKKHPRLVEGLMGSQ